MDEKRLKRFNTANNLNNNALINASFLVDKGHPNGSEIHSISENAIIFIINAKTRLFITVLLARPNQVDRLYKWCNMKTPKNILEKASYYQQNGLNYI